ncbi:hypothetical protein BLNAU_17226 [Blattamonas nauphoetae]|uniref:Protein kinase domain-containing protein n=1 Tax=Blattamonas nauphoetae TaxID=2049346 RepID=A0ABQ9X7H7_9EUKA|nr:hypothetical protein BLNAU_17226 [Blattamonas nauphoetae]
MLCDVTPRSRSDSIAPFVGVGDGHPSLVSSASSDLSDLYNAEMEAISVIGTGLSLVSKELIFGTGPLFSFGMSGQGCSLGVSGCAPLRMETSLLSSTLVNVTSSTSAFSPGKQLFGSEVNQLVVGSCVAQSTNHDSGTGLMSANLGGNLLCLNTSFSSCVRERNAELSYSFQNRTQTSSPARLNNVTSDVTSVSFTLCTFNTITVAGGGYFGGGAIFLQSTSSSLTINTCFFHRCACTADSDDGGAVRVSYPSNNKHPVSLSHSSFSQCSAKDCGGSIMVDVASSMTMDRCFIEQSKAGYDGAMFVASEVLTFSNTALVDCSSTNRAGAITIVQVTALSLSFIQFRGCSSKNNLDAKDIYFMINASVQITSGMIQFCDSTSGAPNVYFNSDRKMDSDLVPQIDPLTIPTITSLDVTFDGDEATVRVGTTNSIKGTMNMLLDGSNVPRLVHVVFGDSTTSSNLGKAVVSSGANGLLPSATYTHRKSTLAPFPPPTVRTADATLKDWNTTEIVVKGVRLEEGSYWILVENEENEWNITLTRSNSTILIGTAPLHPSTAKGRLEWETEYEVTKVMWTDLDGLTAEEVTLSNTITFTTPIEPPRITSVDCALNGKKDVVIVELTGSKLTSDGQTLAVVSRTSNEMVSSGELFNVTSTKCFVNFPIGGSESSTHVVFGGKYELLSVGSGSSSILVDSGLFFEVPHPPRISSLTAPLEVSSSTFVLSGSGENLPSEKTFTVTLTSGHSFSVTFSSTSTGTSTIGIGGSGQLQYNTDYTIKSVIRTVDGEDDLILLSATSFRTPLGPTLSSVSCDYASDPNTLNLTLSTQRMPLEVFTLTLESTESPSESISLTMTSSDISAGFVLVEVYNKTESLKYGTEISIVGMNSSSVVAVVTAPPFPTPSEPIRITSAVCSLGDDKQKSAVVTLNGVKLGGEKRFTVGVRKMEGSTLIGDEIELSGTLSSDSSSVTHTHTELIFGTAKPLLSFETKYVITRFEVEDSISVVDANVTFSVPPESARIVGIKKSQLNNDRTTMIVWLEGRALLSRTGKLSLTNGSTTAESLSNLEILDDTHCSAEFAVGKEVKSDQLKFGETYKLTGSWTETSGFHVEDGITIIVPFIWTVTNMKFEFSTSLHTGCVMHLTGTDLLVGESLNVTLNGSLSFIATITSEIEAKSTELLIGWPTTLQHNKQYTITSIEATHPDDGEILFDPAVSNTTGSLPEDIVIFVDSGSSSDSTLFCGEKTRPCSSIEDGWKIVEGIGISSLSLSIVHNTTQNSQVRMVSEHEVVIESLPTTKPELFVSPSSSLSEMEGEGMVEVAGGRLRLRDVDVLLSDSPSLIFVRMVGGHLTIETCTLASTSSTNSNSDTSLCLWSGGAIILEDAITNITSSTFSELPFGAINIKGGNLKIEGGILHDNNPQLSDFPSFRRNIRCSGEGQVKIGSLSGGDGKADHPHLWLSHDGCVLSGEDVNVNAPFFIPTLSSSSTSTLNKTSQAFDLTMKGSTLIPCSLILEVSETKKDGSVGKTIRIPLSVDSVKSFNETQIEMSLAVSLLSGFEKSLEWCGRVVYGVNETTTSFVIQKNSVDRAARAVIENMKWWIPLLVSLVCLLILIVIIVLICWRRRKNSQKTGQGVKTQELDDENEGRVEVDEKMEETIAGNSVDYLIKSQQTVNPNMNHPDPTTSVRMETQEFVEVIGESGEVRMVDWMKAETLFDVLHRPEKKREIEKKALSRSMTRGLIRVVGRFKTSEITRRFSPHWVLVNNNVVQLRLGTIPEEPPEIEQGTQNDSKQDKTVGEHEVSFFGGRLSAVKSGTAEGQRWRAPEVSRSNVEKIDVESALVFSLGLVLWEVWTGEVPWKEMDEANACRQNEGGIQPNLKLVLDPSIRELISKCLSFDPKDRPSLQDVFDGLVVSEERMADQPSRVAKASDGHDVRS